MSVVPARAPAPELFRKQSVEHATVKAYGNVLLATPVSFTVLTVLFAGIAAAIVLSFVVFSYQRKVQVSGVLVPLTGVVRVMSPQVGVVMARNVRDGQAVSAGDALFVVSSERASATQGNAEKVITSLLESRRQSLVVERGQLREQAGQRVAAASRKADDLSVDVTRIESQIVLQGRRVALAEEALKRSEGLQAQHFVSAAQVQDKLGELLDQRQRLGDLERAMASVARELASVRAEVRDLRIQSDRDAQAASRNIASTEQDLIENEARREFVVRAPRDGVVSAIKAELGQTVSPNQVLASLLPPDAQLIAEVYAPSRAIGFLAVGKEVRLRYQAFPYQKFGQHGGRIAEISTTAMRPDELAVQGAAGGSEPFYRVRVVLDQQTVTAYGAKHTLRSGMAVDASVLLESRPLYQWVLEPLYSVAGRL